MYVRRRSGSTRNCDWTKTLYSRDVSCKLYCELSTLILKKGKESQDQKYEEEKNVKHVVMTIEGETCLVVMTTQAWYLLARLPESKERGCYGRVTIISLSISEKFAKDGQHRNSDDLCFDSFLFNTKLPKSTPKNQKSRAKNLI